MKTTKYLHLLFMTLVVCPVLSFVSLQAEPIAENQQKYKKPALKEAKPGPWALQRSKNPILKKALSYDLDIGLNLSGIQDQKRAEELYLQYISEEPNCPLVPYIYHHLGHLFSGLAGKERQEAGAVRDYAKARGYFKKAIKACPEGAINFYLIGSKVNFAALAPTKDEIVEEYIKCYQWLEEISSPEHKELSAGLQRDVKNLKKIVAANMAGVAWGSGEENIRLDLLKNIIDVFPDKEPGKLAIEKLRKYGDMQVSEAGDAVLEKMELLDRPPVNEKSPKKGVPLFIPKAGMALEQGKPFVFDLANRKLIYVSGKVDTQKAYNYLTKLGKGDIAWNGSLITVRKAKVLTVSQELHRPLKCTPGRWCNVDVLPDGVDLPYSVLVVTNEDVDYLITIHKIPSDGIKISYKKLNADEVKRYLTIEKESK